jgi:hypothetical protein
MEAKMLSAQTKLPRVTGVRHVRDYRLEITFSDDARAELDFREHILGRGGVFVPLQDVSFFCRVEVDREANTLVWPNGVDFCPDVLYHEATGAPLPVPELA